nr:GAF domain-containing sensor histidine kinase [Devosia submarina]
MLDIALQMTGMGFAAIARVTEDRWITCQALDHVAFGLKPGDELPIASTICNEIRGHRTPVVIDDVDDDPAYRNHHTPQIYGLKSYISYPIILADGRFFGTLCAIDTRPAKVRTPVVMGTFKLFAELIGQHLDTGDRLRATQADLVHEQELSELREQFIAVLGHDLRNPIAALDAGTSRLIKEGWTSRSPLVLQLMKTSIGRMSTLVSNVLDLARTRLGDGLVLDMQKADAVQTLVHVMDELRLSHPDRTIVAQLPPQAPILADHNRLAQLFSNLLSNALTHGSMDAPVRVEARLEGDQLQIQVSNAGKPMAADQIDKLFLPFRRGASQSQGLGLGLFIASQIALAHGGTLSARSDECETCFSFQMPCTTSP